MKSAALAGLAVAAVLATLVFLLPLRDCPCCRGLAAEVPVGVEGACGTCRDTGRATWIASRNPHPRCSEWGALMLALRGGSAFDDPGRPEGRAFARVKERGPAAYPHLSQFIDHEDLLLCRTAVAVLNHLTGRAGQMPTEATKAQVKAEWQAWIAARLR